MALDNIGIEVWEWDGLQGCGLIHVSYRPFIRVTIIGEFPPSVTFHVALHLSRLNRMIQELT